MCGSYIGLIEREILDCQAALNGRRSGSELLLPLELPALAHVFPAAPSQLIEHWAVLVGMPYYTPHGIKLSFSVVEKSSTCALVRYI
jgi:hypothetical protein